MDPLSALVLALWVAGYFTRNTVQDLVWKARGEDPPSVRREQARRERRAERAADPGPGRRFWSNVWADAVASAEERRERVAAKKAGKRRVKWAEQDAAAAEDEAYAINERLGDDDPTGPTSDTGSTVQDHMLWACQQCGREMQNAGVDGYPDDERVCRYCRTAEPLPAERPCYFCRSVFPAAELWATRSAEGATVDACQPCWRDHNRTRNRPTNDAGRCDTCNASCDRSALVTRRVEGYGSLWVCPSCADALKRGAPVPLTEQRDRDRDEPDAAAPEPAQPSEPSTQGQDDAEIIQFADWQRPAASDTEKENELSAEITGLQSAIAYANGSAAAAEQAATQDELAIAGLRAGGTTGTAITELQSSMEGHTKNAAHYRNAAAELTRQLQVKEAYEANQGAGTREFVKSE